MDWALEMNPISDGFVAIGWKEVGDLSRIAPDRSAFKEQVARIYPNEKAGAFPVWAGLLYRFTNEMKIGDLIVYPSKPDRRVNIGVIEGDYRHDANQGDYPNRRHVKWLRSLPRTAFSQDALYEIGSAITLFQVKNHADEFLTALDKDESSAPLIDDQESLEAASENTEEATKDFVLKRLKSGLGSYQFEHFVAHLLVCMGYHSRVTQQSGDGGIDIIAHRDELGFEPPIIKVQCKQTFGSIGQPEVSQLYGHIETREHGLFVTLGDYTGQARQFERGKPNLRLLNGSDLVDLIFAHYESFEPRYQTLLPMKRIYIPVGTGREPA